MQAAANPVVAFGCCEPPPDFNITILYDDARAASRAVKICHHLIGVFNNDFLFSIELCDLRSFQEQDGEKTAASKPSARARLVIIAAQGSLSGAAWNWLNDWAAQSQDESAGIAALFEDEWNSEERTTLQRFCERHDVHRLSPDVAPQVDRSRNI